MTTPENQESSIEAKPQPKPRIKKNMNGETFYIPPQILREQIQNFYDTGRMSNDLGNSIKRVVDGLGSSYRFSGYPYLEDMKGDAVLKIVRAINLKNFRTDSSTNPFSYFTTIAFHAFCNRIKVEKKAHETLAKIQDSHYEDILAENSFFGDHIINIKPPKNNED